MKMLRLAVTLLSFCLLSNSSLFAQAPNQVDYTITSGSAVKLDGTSTMHSFHLNTKVISGDMEFDKTNAPNAIDTIGTITSMKVVIPVKNLTSGESGLDEKMQDALKADDNPNITYVLNKVDSVVYNGTSKTDFTMNTYGNLTVAGKTKDIEMKVAGKINGNNIIFTGQKSLKMTDFGVDPPTMFFGVLKTGDVVTISFDVTLAKK
jgi:polyisoprenoid-binding protein YceI